MLPDNFLNKVFCWSRWRGQRFEFERVAGFGRRTAKRFVTSPVEIDHILITELAEFGFQKFRILKAERKNNHGADVAKNGSAGFIVEL